jgi:phosphomevalonate kinase
MDEIVVSAPGKVLIAGGYLVLDPAYPGLVISTTSKFYTIIRPLKPGSTASAAAAAPPLIRVHSPQFINAEWRYGVHIGGAASEVAVTPLESEGGCVDQPARNPRCPRWGGDGGGYILTDALCLRSNKFVYLALQRTLQLVLEKVATETVRSILRTGLDVAIVGDNDFYSQRKQLEARNLVPTTTTTPVAVASLSQLPKFLPTGVSIRDVHKTGLGSSAALITSLVCALLLRFGVVASESLMQGADERDEGRQLAHNLAQYVHCLAQGKVGSGFDVSSAIFGSHIYTRFDPAVIQGLMSDDEVRCRSAPSPPVSLSIRGHTHMLLLDYVCREPRHYLGLCYPRRTPGGITKSSHLPCPL